MSEGERCETRGRVLVVDDDRSLARGLRERLRRNGYDAEERYDVASAIEALRTGAYDLLLADLGLPDASGIDLLTAARAADPRIVGVIMTGNGEVQTAVAAMRHGAFDYLVKPFDRDTVVRTLDRAMEVRRLREDNVHLRDMVATWELCASVASTTGLDAVVARVADAVRGGCAADKVAIMLSTPEGSEFSVAAAYGDGVAVGDRVPADQGTAGWVAHHRQPVRFDGTAFDPPAAGLAAPGDGRPATWHPLLSGGRLVGVIHMSPGAGRPSCSPGDGKGLDLLLGVAAQAIDAAWQHRQVEEGVAGMRESLRQTATALAAALEQRDPYTAGHQQRVARLSCHIARRLGLPDDRIEGLRIAGVLHDIGKIAVPAEILSKPGRLSDVEMGLIRLHPEAGYNIVKSIHFPWPVAEVVLQHHERLDGSGYPAGLADGAISLEARVLAVADVVEAMSSHRPYRPALGRDQALSHLVAGRGALYDADVADACLATFEKDSFAFEEPAG